MKKNMKLNTLTSEECKKQHKIYFRKRRSKNTGNIKLLTQAKVSQKW